MSEIFDKSQIVVKSCKEIFQMFLETKEQQGIDIIMTGRTNDSYNEFATKFTAIYNFKDFLNALCSCDFNWYIEKEQVSLKVCSTQFKKVENNNMLLKVLNDKIGTDVLDSELQHYVLEAIIELLKLVKTKSILIENS